MSSTLTPFFYWFDIFFSKNGVENLFFIYFLFIFLFIFLFWILIFYFFCFSFLRTINYYFYIFLFLLTFHFWYFFDKSFMFYQFITKLYSLQFFNILYFLGIDGISLGLLFLSFFVIIVSVLFYWNLRYKIDFYLFLLFFTLFVLFNIFTVMDIWLFFIFFEIIIFPMFFFIGIWGSRSRKIYASYQFFIFTLLGSVFVFFCFLMIYFIIGSSSFDVFFCFEFFQKWQFFLWLFLFLGFSVKVPVVPFHIWLPEAHVEAPAVGSVILAGILLKLGTYAILRFLMGSFYNIYVDLIFYILLIALIGLSFPSLTAFNQIDIKKIIAYSSVSHMNFSLIGFFSQMVLGLVGSFFMIFSHALTSSGLFFGIGVIYERYKSRLFFYYGSLATFMPFVSIFFFIYIISNFGFPGTISFVGEFLITIGGFFISSVIIFFCSFGLIFNLIYSLSLYNRIFFFIFPPFLRFFSDCTRLEFFILFVHFFFIIFWGLLPQTLLSSSIFCLKKYISFYLFF